MPNDTATGLFANGDWIPYEENFYVSFFQQMKHDSNTDVSLFAVLANVAQTCDTYAPGLRYRRVMARFKPDEYLEGSICPNDIHDSLINIARQLSTK